jgi:hypothetical protein
MIRSVPRLASSSTGHHSAIIGANSVEQLQQSFAALDFTITAAQLAQLDEVSNWQEAKSDSRSHSNSDQINMLFPGSPVCLKSKLNSSTLNDAEKSAIFCQNHTEPGLSLIP